MQDDEFVEDDEPPTYTKPQSSTNSKIDLTDVDPELYGLRRSGRSAQKQNFDPTYIDDFIDDDDDDFSDAPKRKSRKSKSNSRSSKKGKWL